MRGRQQGPYHNWRETVITDNFNTPNLVHAEALSAPHLLTAVQHQRFLPQPTGVVTAKSSSIPQQKVPSTVNARENAPSLLILCSENSPNLEFQFGISQNSTSTGKRFA